MVTIACPYCITSYVRSCVASGTLVGEGQQAGKESWIPNASALDWRGKSGMAPKDHYAVAEEEPIPIASPSKQTVVKVSRASHAILGDCFVKLGG